MSEHHNHPEVEEAMTELLSAIPENQRAQVVENLFGKNTKIDSALLESGTMVERLAASIKQTNPIVALGDNRALGLDYLFATLQGDLPALRALRQDTFNNLAARYVQMKSDEQTSQMVAKGDFGYKWEGRHLDEKTRETFHKMVPILMTIESK